MLTAPKRGGLCRNYSNSLFFYAFGRCSCAAPRPVTIGYRLGAAAPAFADIRPGTPAVDPIVQALMLTDVVVEMTVTALLPAPTVQAHERTGTLDPNSLGIIRG